MKDIAIHSTSSINGLLEKTTKNTMENNLKTLIIKYIKDPGSAITHFIGMVMAIPAAIPLLIKAARQSDPLYIVAMGVYALSLILLYTASTAYHTFDRSERINTILKKIDHMMISVLIAGSYTPICLLVLEKKNRSCSPWHRMGNRSYRNPDQSILGILPEMGILRTLYRHGLDLRIGIWANFPRYVTRRVWMASGRRNHLHCRRCNLRIKTSGFQ